MAMGRSSQAGQQVHVRSCLRRHIRFTSGELASEEARFRPICRERLCPVLRVADGVGVTGAGDMFCLRLINYIEGIDSERGIGWRVADTLALRGFLGLGLEQMPPDHPTISRCHATTPSAGHDSLKRLLIPLLRVQSVAGFAEANGKWDSLRLPAGYSVCSWYLYLQLLIVSCWQARDCFRRRRSEGISLQHAVRQHEQKLTFTTGG